MSGSQPETRAGRVFFSPFFMAFDFFTLRFLAADLQQHLGGKKINRVGSSSRELGFSCEKSGHVYVRAGAQGYLCLMAGRLPAYLSDQSGPVRYLLQARVEAVWAERRDRIIRIRLSREDRTGTTTYGQLIVELFSPRCQVALIREKNGQILGLWPESGGRGRHERLVVGQPYIAPPVQHRLLPGEDDFALFCEVARKEERRVDEFLAGSLVGMGRAIVPEVLYRTGQAGQVKTSELDEGHLRTLWEGVVELYTHLPESGGFVWKTGAQYAFSALEPTYRGADRVRLPTISQAMVRALEENQSAEGDRQRGREVKQVLTRVLNAARRKIQAIQEDLEEASRVEELEKKGNVLMAQLGQVPSGVSQVELPDVYDISGKARIEIELKVQRSPAENARWFLKTAKKYRRRRQILPGRLELLQGEVKNLEEMLQRLADGEVPDADTLQKWLGGRSVMTTKNTSPGYREIAAHPRRYRTSQGWSVWAGRNNKENDVLTHRLAAQNDIWFHAHGYAGSHVVLRREGRPDDPSGRTLEEAAGIAAYWSKGKTARKVPVVYTLVKYVSKPRGGAPGKALLKREKTLMVEPALLPEEDQVDPQRLF